MKSAQSATPKEGIVRTLTTTLATLTGFGAIGAILYILAYVGDIAATMGASL